MDFLILIFMLTIFTTWLAALLDIDITLVASNRTNTDNIWESTTFPNVVRICSEHSYQNASCSDHADLSQPFLSCVTCICSLQSLKLLFCFLEKALISFDYCRCQDVLLDSMELGKNIARNSALKENVFMMAVCIDLRIPLFLVGKPGSSKSLAKSIIANSMNGKSSKNPLLKSFKEV